jgi:diguanylate cyclase (GGDEF)-like protein
MTSMTLPRRRATAAAAVGLIVFAGWLYFGWGGPTATTVASSVGSVASSAFATACAVTAARSGRARQRIAWSCLGVGLAGWVVGNLIWTYYLVVTGEWPPFPSAADAFYLLLPLGTCVAAVFAPSTGGRSGVRVLLDGLLVTASIFLIAWTVGLHAVYDDYATSGLTFATSAVYPFADFAMVTMIAVVLAKTRPGRRVSPALLLAGVAIVWITDSGYAYLLSNPHDSREAVVLGWAIAMYFVGVAALTSKPLTAIDDEQRKAPSRVELWLPYLPVPFAFTFGVVEVWPHTGSSPVIVTGMILALAVLLRQFTLLTENRQLLDTVADMALRDDLTGLANRALFGDRLEHAMQLRLRNDTSVAVLVADLDDFKLVNDTLGHPVGDKLLCDVGERIQNSVRSGDTVARLGGDEFAILVEDSPAVADEIAELVVRSFDEPFTVEGRTLHVRLSIGLASASSDLDSDVTADELFKRADLAMYSAKRAHDTGARAFIPEMGRRDGFARIRLLADLRRAIGERQLELVYQPKFSLATGTAVGVEALVRWPHPEFGTLEPADFLPLVRENGLMEALTEVVIDRAIGDAAGWYQMGIVLPVAINLSAPSLDDAGLPDRILSALTDSGMPATSFMVEITEDLLLASVVRARAVLDRLREFGIRVAIDDFGSGYGAMTYLHELPIDELKLDRQFIAPIRYDGRAAAIVRSVIELANTLGLACVAEGVENKATADLLKSYDCGFVQGYYFSPPVSAKTIRPGIWGSGVVGSRITPTAATPPSSA